LIDFGLCECRFDISYDRVSLELMMFLMIRMLWLVMLLLRFLRICMMLDDWVFELYDDIVI